MCLRTSSFPSKVQTTEIASHFSKLLDREENDFCSRSIPSPLPPSTPLRIEEDDFDGLRLSTSFISFAFFPFFFGLNGIIVARE